jgi:hypothetical protein
MCGGGSLGPFQVYQRQTQTPGGQGGEGVKQRFLCSNCEYNWRGCHVPRRPNVTKEEGCKDYWPKGRKREPQLDKLDKAWVDGLDLRGLGKKGKGKGKK